MIWGAGAINGCHIPINATQDIHRDYLNQKSGAVSSVITYIYSGHFQKESQLFPSGIRKNHCLTRMCSHLWKSFVNIMQSLAESVISSYAIQVISVLLCVVAITELSQETSLKNKYAHLCVMFTIEVSWTKCD